MFFSDLGLPIGSPVGPERIGHQEGALTKFNLRAYARKLNFDWRKNLNFGSSNLAIWQGHMAKPYGRAIWQSHMAEPYGRAIYGSRGRNHFLIFFALEP